MDDFQKFVEEAAARGQQVRFVQLNGGCPVHGNDGCPDPLDALLGSVDSAEVLRTVKSAFLGATHRISEGDSNSAHDRLALADVGLELYDRLVTREERAKMEPRVGPMDALTKRLRQEQQRRTAERDAEILRNEKTDPDHGSTFRSVSEAAEAFAQPVENKETAEEYADRMRALKAAGREGDPEIG